MKVIDREGTFQAWAVAHAIKEIGQNHLAALAVDYQIATELQDDGSWADVSQEEMTITASHFLIKKDGNLNTSTTDQIKRAYAWWAGDIEQLENADLSQTLVQITVKSEDYNGKTQFKVGWLSGAEDDPMTGLTTPNPGQARKIANNLNSKIRAHMGGTPAGGAAPQGRPKAPGAPGAAASNAGAKDLNEMAGEAKRRGRSAAPKPAAAPQAGTPAPPASPAAPNAAAPPRAAGRPAAPKPPAPPKPTVDDSPEARIAASDEAWKIVHGACPAKWNDQERETEFWRIIGEMFPGRDISKIENLSVEEWTKVRLEAANKINPL